MDPIVDYDIFRGQFLWIELEIIEGVSPNIDFLIEHLWK